MKYKLLKDDNIQFSNKTICRIQALKDFGNVKKGDVGGFIEDERNLVQYGFARISGNARVFGFTKVSE